MTDRGGEIVRSWSTNAEAWTTAVRDGRIPSRRAGTDAAILRAILRHAPRAVLDVGCGEGWLLRVLANHGVRACGTDVSAELVEAARAAGSAEVLVASYDQLQRDPDLVAGPWDVIVCNFSLLDDQPVPILGALRRRLAPRGMVVVQTVHPWAARGDARYEDGWRTETFDAFPGQFPASMPWYYRTLGSWVAAVAEAGLWLRDVEEPLHPGTGVPLSLVLHAEAR